MDLNGAIIEILVPFLILIFIITFWYFGPYLFELGYKKDVKSMRKVVVEEEEEYSRGTIKRRLNKIVDKSVFNFYSYKTVLKILLKSGYFKELTRKEVIQYFQSKEEIVHKKLLLIDFISILCEVTGKDFQEELNKICYKDPL